MKTLFWIGLIVLGLGIVSLFVPIPHNQEQGIKAGGLSLGIQVKSEEKVSPIISGVLILGGVGLIIAGKRAA
jgi:hypothetical protein